MNRRTPLLRRLATIRDLYGLLRKWTFDGRLSCLIDAVRLDYIAEKLWREDRRAS